MLTSVFDSSALGKWIYDWSVSEHGPSTPITEMAGELWLHLIQLAGKTRLGEIAMPRIRDQGDREMVEDFLESGERLWIRFAKLLYIAENKLWQAAIEENGGKTPINFSKEITGYEVVQTIFGRDRELERTEKWMTGARLWSMRFDANCDSVIWEVGGANINWRRRKTEDQRGDAMSYIIKSKEASKPEKPERSHKSRRRQEDASPLRRYRVVEPEPSSRIKSSSLDHTSPYIRHA